MITPGSSGKAGPTPISLGEQERPAFRFGGRTIHLGDEVTGFHRTRGHAVEGTALFAFDCLCLATDEGVFPFSRLSILTVITPSWA